MLCVGVVAAFVSFAAIFLLLRMLPNPAQGFIVPTSLAVAAAFAAGYRLTTHYHQTLVAWLLASIAIPAGYILFAQLLLPDAQDGWGAIAYIFGTSYPVLAGNVGVVLGLLVNRHARHDA
jgi:hypothetical protein